MWTEFCVNNNGAQLYCRYIGSGKPLLLIHGSACDSDFFVPACEYLSRSRRVIIYDRRGYGKSAGDGRHYPDREAFCRLQASDAAAVIEACGITSIDVCGCSVGGLIALHLASYYRLVERLIVHEVPISEYIPPENSIFEANERVAEIKKVSMGRAFAVFLEWQGNADDRGEPLTEDEISHLDANISNYFETEQQHTYSKGNTLPPLSTGQRLTVALGERSLNSHLVYCAEELSERNDARLVPFPGGHNAAREIPAAFSAVVDGILNLDL